MLIEGRKLKKYYKQGENQIIKAVDGVNVKIDSGEFVVVLGQSGCGKSTLLNLVGGMDKPTEGKIVVDGENLSKKSNNELSKYRREMTGMVFQKFNLISDMTTLENVALPLKFSGYSEKEQKDKALQALEKVGLKDRAESEPKKLSGGQQQRVAIARALVNNPKILLADEPTGNLDSKTGDEIVDLLHELSRRGHTVIMVTHNKKYESSADRVIKMLDGKVVDEKAKNDVQQAKDLKVLPSKSISLRALFKLALKNLGRRKLRVFLTSFGVAIGAMAVVILVAFGAGMQRDALEAMKGNTEVEEINVMKTERNISFSMGPDYKKPEEIKLNDKVLEKLKEVPGAKAAYPSVTIQGEGKIKENNLVRYWGGTLSPVELLRDNFKERVEYGRIFESNDESSTIVPYQMAEAFGFENVEDALGEKMKLTVKSLSGDKQFELEVVGILSQDDKFAFSAYIPNEKATSMIKIIKEDELEKPDPDLYEAITVRAKDTASVESVKEAIENDLNYPTSSFEDVASQVNRSFLIMQIVLGVIGGIALLVASLGIVNTILMSVLERTKEIGVMKALGARSRDIRSIFLSEAFLIGILGGIVGLLLGYAGTNIIEVVVNQYMENQGTGSDQLTFFVPLYLSFGVVAFSALVASAAGYFPARRAANLDPVVALRE